MDEELGHGSPVPISVEVEMAWQEAGHRDPVGIWEEVKFI